VPGLNALPGVSCVTPRGAFYAFPNISGTGLGAGELAERLLLDAGVAVLSGTAFGEYGEGYLRLSYANSLEQIEEALSLMEKTFSVLSTATEGEPDAADRGEAVRPSHQ
jgi:aspartate/methionine/tyrosine aminotransferase